MPKPDLVQEALTRARDFHKTGKRNADWKPFITTFPDLKCPDMPFCLVPTGTFQMGADDISLYEKPIHPQTFDSPFFIAQYPVTNAQWALSVKAGAVSDPRGGISLGWYKDPAMSNAPVVGVSWFEGQKFAAWMGCGLPTEREWEYSARGVDNLMYPWGNEFIAEHLVYKANSDGKPWDVTTKPDGASWVGATHLSGNAQEWTASLYEKYPYQVDGSRERDTGDNEDIRRILRGSSWFSKQEYALTATRHLSSPFNRDYTMGLRLVLHPASLET